MRSRQARYGAGVSTTRSAVPDGATPPVAVAVLALPGVVPFDLSIPCDAFGWTARADGSPAYRVEVCAVDPATPVDAGAFALCAPHGLDALRRAATVVVPGVRDPLAPVPVPALDALRDAAAGGARVASVCSGAFVLAQAGLLDGRRATTHWKGVAELARRFPRVTVDPDVLYVDEGAILTSAGAAAGMDLCLHLVRRDHGPAVAAATARAAVMAPERAGGQSQFVDHEPPPDPGASLAPLLAWIERHLADDLAVEDLAARAHVSPRTLTRRFREQTGTTPLQWLLRARVRRAQQLLEATDEPIAGVARRTGFGSGASFRQRFARVVGVSPQRYREAFRARGDDARGVAA
jgi:transcriptional regulator GlxA family with amidase domain